MIQVWGLIVGGAIALAASGHFCGAQCTASETRAYADWPALIMAVGASAAGCSRVSSAGGKSGRCGSRVRTAVVCRTTGSMSMA